MKRVLLSVLLACAGFQANAAVIDFNDLTGSGLVGRGFHYEEDGFALDSSATDYPFYSIQAGDTRYTGSTSFLNDSVGGITRLTKVGGGAFSLNSIDLDSLNGGEEVNVTFVADLVGGGTVSTMFTTDSLFSTLQTFMFGAGFANVTSVSWVQDSPFHSFDNIVVGAGNSVPEPATLGLLGLGLAGLGLARRRKA